MDGFFIRFNPSHQFHPCPIENTKYSILHRGLPDIAKAIHHSENFFTCPLDDFHASFTMDLDVHGYVDCVLAAAANHHSSV
jgi:hypothetical protein